jgi:AAA15 family ATPase/GTPase
MSQLYKIGLQNFRVFKEMTEFDLAPLTILTGANSSGKSSLFKALLLMGNNVESNSFYKLDFTGTQHNLGSFQDAINKKCDKEKIVFRFYLNYPFQSTRKYPMPSGRKLTNIYLSSDIETETKMILEVSYKEDNSNGLLSSLSIYVQDRANKTTLLFAETNELDSQKKMHRLTINIKWFAKNYDVIQSFRRFPNRIEKKIVNDFNEDDLKTFEIPYSKNIEKNARGYRKFSLQETDDVGYILNYFFANQDNFISKEDFKILRVDRNQYAHSSGIFRDIEHFIRYDLLREAGYHFENTEYVEAVRAKSRRIYTHDSQTTLFDELLLDYNSVQLDLQAENFLKRWIKELEIADDVSFEKIAGGIATQVIFYKNGDKYPLADLGYGVTQYLPLLLKIALQISTESSNDRIRTPFREKPLKKTIILEEPETNLHPKLQSRLADMILDALQNFEIKFIIETHSEYFIRRLQILTAEKKAKSEEIALYYFYEPYKIPQGQKQVEKINILSDGNLDNDFGSGFFDEATNMKFELLKLKTKKK